MTRPYALPAALVAASVLLFASSCSSDSGDAADATTTTESATTEAQSATTTAVAEEPITVLVTNDDGVGAEGIDALVQGLQAIDGVEVVVVAPAENQSGSGGKTTPGTLTATDATTASGTEATAVAGFPADSVIWALGEGGIEPDFVISGINEGQNIGPVVPLSGTVGAARQAAQLGVPALAVSQGLGEDPDYPTGVDAALAWFEESLPAIRDGSIGTGSITSINIPNCAEADVRGPVEVPVATDSTADLNAVDCAGTAEPTDDVTAFTNGYVTISVLEPTGSVTS